MGQESRILEQLIQDKENREMNNRWNFNQTKDLMKPFDNKVLIQKNNPTLATNDKTKLELNSVKPKNIVDPSIVDHKCSILNYLVEKQSTYSIDINYMSRQTEITLKMRAILIDWFVDVIVKFRMRFNTLFLAVHFLDQYLQNNHSTKADLQLVGVSVLMIASKMEEIYPPSSSKYEIICDHAYTNNQILKMEQHILLKLAFDLNPATMISLLDLLNTELKLQPLQYYFCIYMLENLLLEISSFKYSYLTLVLGTIYLVSKIYAVKETELVVLQKMNNNLEELKSCAKDIFLIIKRNEKISLGAIKKQFSIPEYYEISKYRLEKGN